tara:strand:+ start:413 stop:1345 length:933 start_codon:yes stop_codon:yes gene_type:complete
MKLSIRCKLYLIYIISILFINSNLSQRNNPIIIDADTANEVDDLFAIVSAILEPSFEILGISSAQFHTSPIASNSSTLESQLINSEILQLLKFNTTLPLGAFNPIINKNTPQISEASNFIIKSAHKLEKGKRLKLIILGSCTNVSSAIIQDPSIIPKIEVFYLGFWHDSKSNSYNKNEFNTRNDPIALEVLLNTIDLQFNVMSATTSQYLVFNKNKVDIVLKGKGGISDYLVNRWESYNRWWTDLDKDKKQWIMWDLALIEAISKPSLAKKKLFHTPKENIDRIISIYTSINEKDMQEYFWSKLESLSKD